MHWPSAVFAAASDDGDDAGGCASSLHGILAVIFTYRVSSTEHI